MKEKFICIVFTMLIIISASCQTTTETVSDVKNELEFTSDNIGMEGFELTYIEAVKHTMSTAGKGYPSIVIQLANYDRGSRSYLPNPVEEGQRRVMINFSAPAGQELKATTYSLDAPMAEGYRLSVGIEKMGESIGLYNGSGSGEILFIDDETIAGKVDVKDSRGALIKASFSTPWEKSRY